MLIGIFYSQIVVSVLFREAISHPFISFFHLLVNVFYVIREYGSTLYVGLARAVSPTNIYKLPVNLFTNLTTGGFL